MSVSAHVVSSNIVYIHNPKMNVAITSLWFNAGSIFDGDKHGLAHFFEHFLLTKTKSVPKNRAAYLESRGIESFALTYKEFAYVYHVSSPEIIRDSTSLLLDGVYNIILNEGSLKSERDIIKREIKERGFEQKFWDTIYANLYPDTPYSHCVLGNDKSLDSITLKDLKVFWKEKYYDQAPVCLILSPEPFSPVMSSFLQKNISQQPQNKSNTQVSVLKKDLFSLLKKDTETSDVRIAYSYRLPEQMTLKERCTVDFLRSIFAGSWNSLYTKEFRQKKSYTYWTYGAAFTTYRSKSLHFYFDVSRKNIKEVDRKVASVCKSFASKPLSQRELNMYKVAYVTSQLLYAEDSKSLLFDIGSSLISGQDIILPQQQIEIVQKLSAQDVWLFWKKIYKKEGGIRTIL